MDKSSIVILAATSVEFQIAIAVIVSLVIAYWVVDVIEGSNRARMASRLAELEDIETSHEGCDGGQWADELANDLTTSLRRVHDLMERGFDKDARHELERAIETVEEVAA